MKKKLTKVSKNGQAQKGATTGATQGGNNRSDIFSLCNHLKTDAVVLIYNSWILNFNILKKQMLHPL